MASLLGPYTVEDYYEGFGIFDRNSNPVQDIVNGKLTDLILPTAAIAQPMADKLTADDTAYLAALDRHSSYPYDSERRAVAHIQLIVQINENDGAFNQDIYDNAQAALRLLGA